MNHSFKPLQFQPKGKSMMVAYEIGQLNTVKKFQVILNNMNQNKTKKSKKVMTQNEDRKKNNIINVLKGKRITVESDGVRRSILSVQDKN